MRRSKLNAFAHGSRDAAEQLVANLTRAGELIRSFKQVAVDRSQAERRSFDLLEATQQIIVSLRPSLSPHRVAIEVERHHLTNRLARGERDWLIEHHRRPARERQLRVLGTCRVVGELEIRLGLAGR